MAELLDAVVSWPSLVLVLVVFGFAPGLCLRLIVLAYPRSGPRRAELIAELYAVPRIQRPLWVAEQLEVALFEGLGHRVSAIIRWLADRRRARAQTDKRGVWVGEVPARAVQLVMMVTVGALVIINQPLGEGSTIFGIVDVIVSALLVIMLYREHRLWGRRDRTR